MSIDGEASAVERQLGWLEARGSHFEIGKALGRQGQRAVHDLLLESELWQLVTAPRHAQVVTNMMARTQARFPWIMKELEGLAAGLELPLHDVFAWNCRGDLLANCPDGCTSVMLPGKAPRIAHNEDGLPFFDGASFMAQLRPPNQPGFIAFCYPGSIPGHTFSLTQANIVQTVNNLRLIDVQAQLPRMVLGRAMLAAEDLDAIFSLLESAPPGGGFHFTLAQLGIPDIWSLEVGGGKVCRNLIDSPTVHANHALYLPHEQITTASSSDRQERGENMLKAGVRDPLEILADTGGEGLPILRRSPDDPDEENTLATAVFRLLDMEIQWEVHTPGNHCVYHGTSQTLFN